MLRTLIICGAMMSGAAAHAQEAPAPVAVMDDAAAGEEVFVTECRVCHGGLIAPSLRGVVGRQIASVPTFGGYSAGLKARNGETWTEEKLSQFLAAPAVFAPGTAMSKNLADPKARRAVIAFLESMTTPH